MLEVPESRALLLKGQVGVWLPLDGRQQNRGEQNQGAGKGQKLASGTTSEKGSGKAAGTAEPLVSNRG